MLDDVHVRCSTCRTALSAQVLWATGDACPRCSQRLLVTSSRRPAARGADGKTTAVLITGSPRVVARHPIARR